MTTSHHIPTSLIHYLDQYEAHYEVIPHKRDFTALSAAADTHTPPASFAKCVLVWIDNYYAMVVTTADSWVDLRMLRDSLNANDAGLVREEEMHKLFPDCELGAEPIFGNLYDLPVIVDTLLSRDEMITFNAGTHDEAIRMPFAEFARLVEPQILDCARPD
jgi:Ala-tRNA(Pro) deacylase